MESFKNILPWVAAAAHSDGVPVGPPHGVAGALEAPGPEVWTTSRGQEVEISKSIHLKLIRYKLVYSDLDALELESRLTILRPLERHHLSASCQVKERPVWSQLAR